MANARESLIATIEAQRASSSDIEVAVSLEDFFTGNDDLGSIGSNLGDEQPPISEFYRVLKEIRSKPEVQDVLVRIYAHDDPSSWPNTDTVYIITSASPDEVEKWVACIKPDEVRAEWMYGKPPVAREPSSGMTPYSVWWD
jgi:hypothetical protein